MAVKYATFYRMGSLDADFKLFKFKLSVIFIVLLRNIDYLKLVKKKQKIFFNKKSKHLVYYRNCIGQTRFMAIQFILQ